MNRLWLNMARADSSALRKGPAFGETVKTVNVVTRRLDTPLKRCVNEKHRRFLSWQLVLVGSACLLLVSGCSSFRTEIGRPVSAEASGFALGKSRAENVLQELGPPDSASNLPDGFAFLYEHSIVREFQLGISVNYSFLRYFKLIHAWNSLDQEAFLFTFDNHGILQNAGGKKWKEDLGGGTALQFVLNVMSLSDLSRFLRPADAHEWGEALLEPAPIALNSAQSLRTGEHGLRQARMAPDYAGQHTMEMAKPKTEKEKRKIKKNYQSQP